jgi:hypothetical protein
MAFRRKVDENLIRRASHRGSMLQPKDVNQILRQSRWRGLPIMSLVPLVPLEILHVALVLFRSLPRSEGAEVAALAGLRIYFSGIEPVFAGLQFADHGGASFSLFIAIIVIAARLFHACHGGARHSRNVTLT